MLILLLLFTACSKSRSFVILTDQISLAEILADYQSKHPEVTLDIEYFENVFDGYFNHNIRPDLVVSKGLQSKRMVAESADLTKLFAEGFDFKPYLNGIFYKANGKNIRNVILSFDLPLIFSSILPNTKGDFAEKSLLTVETLRDEAIQYNKKSSRGDLKKIGFPIYSQKEFLQYYLDYKGIKIVEGRRGEPQWDEGEISKVFSELKFWADKNAISANDEAEYLGRIKDQSQINWIENGIITHGFFKASQFFSTTLNKNGQSNFQWLVKKQKIISLNNLVSVMIPNSSSQFDKAGEILLYLLNPEVQSKAIANAQAHFGSSFGFLSGFPTSISQYETDMPLSYTRLRGKLPPLSVIEISENTFSDIDEWSKLVLLPYIQDYLSTQKKPESLASKTNLWLKQRSNFN